MLVDGVSVGAVSSYQAQNVTGPHSISASFAIDTFTVTPSGTAHGSVTPSAPQTVEYGSSITMTFTPDSGYYIADVVVDGESWGFLPTLTLTNITGNHTIGVSFGQSSGRYEQTDSRISFVGSWTTLARTFHSGGSYMYTNVAGSRVTVKFHGTAIDYITNKDRVYGIAQVVLDSGTPVNVDLYSGIRNIAQAKVWSASGLADADHTLVISYINKKNPLSSGYYIGLDAVNITGTLLQAP